MKIKKIVDHAAFASIGVHFCTCGLPPLLILFGSTAILLPIPHPIMTFILIAAGLLLATSILMECAGYGCKKSKMRVICLIVCVFLYIMGLAGHFGLIPLNTPNDEHAEMSCH